MRICFIISLAAHVSLLLLGYFANISTPESSEIEFEFADVSIIKLDDWVAISTPAPMLVEEPEQLSSPDVLDQEVPTPAIPVSEPIVETPAIPQSASLASVAPAVPTRPEFTVPSTPAPPPRMQAPEVVVPPAPPPPQEPETAPEVEDEAEQAAPKISSEAAPEPEPDVVQDDEVKQATTPDDSTESAQEEVEESTAPEQAATKIVTEADEAEELRVAAPIRRPSYLASRADLPNDPEKRAGETEPEEEAEAEREENPEDADDPLAGSTPGQAEIDSLIEQSQLEQVESAEDKESSTESLLALSNEGAPIPSSISEGLRRAIRDCWNVGALSTAGMRTVLTVGFSLEIDGKLRSETIKLVDAQSESEIATSRAFEAARRAIICGLSSGLEFPPENYSSWQNIEMRFDPEQMLSK